MEKEMNIDVMEKKWNRIMMDKKERENDIIEEIKRLERLKRLEEKVNSEMKKVEYRLEEMEKRIEDEDNSIDSIKKIDEKKNVDIMEKEIRIKEDRIKRLFGDVKRIRDGR